MLLRDEVACLSRKALVHEKHKKIQEIDWII